MTQLACQVTCRRVCIAAWTLAVWIALYHGWRGSTLLLLAVFAQCPFQDDMTSPVSAAPGGRSLLALFRVSTAAFGCASPCSHRRADQPAGGA